jgi:DNA-binding LytR/AlgR family response regulator
MMSLEKKLPPELFVRIHRSYIVNFNKLHAITSSEVEVIEKNQIKALPIGKNYKEVFDAVIESKRL